MEILNTIFSGFDSLSGKHGLEKIKTVGDAYMVVGGLTREPQDYAYHIADMALEVREFVANCTELAQYNLAIHIGIASGPAVAGVVGVKRFVYDLWGDTVNVASRLTDAAPTGKILVDKATYDRLRQDYLFEPPINVNVQGKGDVAAYSLVRKG